MIGFADRMVEDAPLLARQVAAGDAVENQCGGVRGETGANNRQAAIVGLLQHVGEAVPERLTRQVGLGDVGAGDDQGIQFRVVDFRAVPVVLPEMLAAFVPAGDPLDREEVHGAAAFLVAVHELQELTLGRGQRTVRHHVEQADVQAGRRFRGPLDHPGPVFRNPVQAGQVLQVQQGHGG